MKPLRKGVFPCLDKLSSHEAVKFVKRGNCLFSVYLMSSLLKHLYLYTRPWNYKTLIGGVNNQPEVAKILLLKTLVLSCPCQSSL